MIQHLVCASSPEEIDAWAAQWLQERGYHVIPPSAEERPDEICRRLAISQDTLRRRLRSRWCPPVPHRRSPTGRLVAIASYPDADFFFSTGRRRTPQKLRVGVR